MMKDEVPRGGSNKKKGYVIRTGNRDDRIEYGDNQCVNLP